ncbi:MAG TPA: ATP-binding protein [Thermoanaerobaculia bacterium]|nr:ATP-binding protein [Thermoanaerobaculia bacterium]
MAGRVLLLGQTDKKRTLDVLGAFGIEVVHLVDENDAIQRLGSESFDFVATESLPLSEQLIESIARHGSPAIVDLSTMPASTTPEDSAGFSRLAAVVEASPMAIAVVSPSDFRIEMANALFVDLAVRFGSVSAPDLRGASMGETLPEILPVLEEVRRANRPHLDETVKLNSAPHTGVFKRIVTPVLNPAGELDCLAILFLDITQHLRAATEIEALARMIARRSARLDSILGSMTDALWLYDEHGEVIDVNQSALNMFGLGSKQEAISHGDFSQFQIRDHEEKPLPLTRLPHSLALEGKIVPDYVAVGRHMITGKDIDLSIAAAPVHGEEGIAGAVLVIRDITALKELDRKKDEFLSVASHELRTPLTTIKGYTQLLTQSGDLTAPADRTLFLNAALGEIDRMMRLISELLDVSRIETNRFQLHRQPLEWLAFVEKLVAACRIQYPDRALELISEIPEITLQLDEDRMRQVVDNLLSNAIKYSRDATGVEITVRVKGDVLETSVTDHGIGIPRDEIPYLFERFRRARNVSSRHYGGLGLGLYISKAIVEAHSGDISIASEEGEGSTFVITLPLEPRSGNV